MPASLYNSGQTPLLSIISITLNDRDGLVRTVTSLQDQTGSVAIEHIVVDGGSGYDVRAVLEGLKWQANLHSGADSGLYDAMNTGIRMARGEYLLFLNSGDILADADILSSISQVLQTKSPDFLFGDSLEKQLDGTVRFKPARPLRSLPYGMITHHQAMIFRRSVIDDHAIAYDLNYPIAADYDFVLRVLKHCQNPEFLPQEICLFEHGGLSYQKRDQARLEQFRIRRAAYGSPVFAAWVFALQWGLSSFREAFPSGYWAIRRRFG